MCPLYLNIIQTLLNEPQKSQRKLSRELSLSLSYINKNLQTMEKEGLILKEKGLKPNYIVSEKGRQLYFSCKVDNAIILAAGFGSRFVPLSYATPKGLLEVFGEPLIERQIRQLLEIGITDITIVVGYLKEMFEYLIDKYNVKIIFNSEYAKKNNLSSLYIAREELKNTYILSSDNWLRSNMFHTYESDSWYSAVFAKGKTKEWCLSLDRKNKIIDVSVGGSKKWFMYGPVYFSEIFSKKIKPLIEEAYNSPDSDDWYWEDVFIRNLDKLSMYCNPQSENQVYEFESLDELRHFDKSYLKDSDNPIIDLISKSFKVPQKDVKNFKPLRFGMTNKSFLFEIHDKKYIFRIPGEGTDKLINRNQEFDAYKAIENLKICDKVLYFSSENGYKITRFEEGSRNADAHNESDLIRCMKIARKLHSSNLKVNAIWDFREKIDFYENLAQGYHGILYADYAEVRKTMDILLDWIEKRNPQKAFTHIDLVPDNFIISGFLDSKIQLIDWEYASMCDPLADIAMFAIYAYYSKEELDHLIELYFERPPTQDEQTRIYCYVSLSGFMWALWTCYKQALGVEFGDYGMKMYRYAKDFFKLVIKQIKK